MDQNSTDETSRIWLNTGDLRRAAEAGVISQEDTQTLIEWAERESETRRENAPVQVEEPKGFNLVTVAYYFGAMLMIGACGWFLGDKWEELGSTGILVTALIYAIVSLSLGLWLRGKGFVVGGGLLVTVAVCLVPLITYTIEDLLGFWPAGRPAEYKDYPRPHGSLIVIGLATITSALVALRFIRFGFLIKPLLFSFWFFSMDVAELILGDERMRTGNSRAWVSVIVGLIAIFMGYGLDRTLHKQGEPRSEDFAFWFYLFGLMASWGGLTLMDSDLEFSKAIYAVINLGLIGMAIKLKRTVFLVFGAIGIHAYLGHLAYRVFQDSFLFPFVLAFLGLSLIIVTVLAQRYLGRLSKDVP